LKFKVCLVGDAGVGKTSLLNQFVHKSFSDLYLKTLGTNVSKKSVAVDRDGGEVQVELLVWDIQGQMNLRQMVKGMLADSHGALVVCDVTRPETLESVYGWLALIMETNARPLPVFVGNKADLGGRIGIDDLKAVADRFRAPAFVTSARTGENVEEAFRLLAGALAGNAVGYFSGGDFYEGGMEGVIVPPKEVSELDVLEDRLFMGFCEAIGGYEVSVPLLRAMFREWGLDFEELDAAKLERMAPRFVDLVGWMQGEKAAAEMKAKIDGIFGQPQSP